MTKPPSAIDSFRWSFQRAPRRASLEPLELMMPALLELVDRVEKLEQLEKHDLPLCAPAVDVSYAIEYLQELIHPLYPAKKTTEEYKKSRLSCQIAINILQQHQRGNDTK